MNSAERFYCLISIESGRFTDSLVQAYTEHFRAKGTLQFVVLDEPERHNIMVFENVPEEEALNLARHRGKDKAEMLGLDREQLLDWRELCRSIPYARCYERVREAFDASRSFRRHCLSQVFSNVQPKLRRIGVTRKSQPVVARLAPYLLEELAVKLGVVETGLFTGEVLPAKEMTLVTAAYEGRYFSCSPRAPSFRIVVFDGVSLEESVLPASRLERSGA